MSRVREAVEVRHLWDQEFGHHLTIGGDGLRRSLSAPPSHYAVRLRRDSVRGVHLTVHVGASDLVEVVTEDGERVTAEAVGANLSPTILRVRHDPVDEERTEDMLAEEGREGRPAPAYDADATYKALGSFARRLRRHIVSMCNADTFGKAERWAWGKSRSHPARVQLTRLRAVEEAMDAVGGLGMEIPLPPDPKDG